MKLLYFKLIIVLEYVLIVFSNSQEDDDVYKGKYIGKLKSYHHQVSGEVFAVDEYTILFKNFNYDGNGLDTYFWAGITNRPGPQGFLVANEHGRTDLLLRYLNKDFTLTLPDGKKITDIKWFAIYDLTNQVAFADLYIPEEFDPPSAKKIGELSRLSNHVSSGSIEILDAKTIRIPNFRYDGKAKNAHFWMGVGPQPVSKGHIIPDENGYMDAIRAYEDETIVLHIPGNFAIFQIDWFSIFDLDSMANLGSVVIPSELNLPPSLTQIITHDSNLPFCRQLHSDYQVSWEVFGPQITIQLAAQIGKNDYMSFGLSGSEQKSQVVGADVAVTYLDDYRGQAVDYNISALTPCVKVLGQYKGVCRDELVGGQENNQLLTAVRENGVNIITYRRSLISSDSGDKEFDINKPLYIVWAMGRLNEKKEPAFHDYYSKANIKIDLSLKEPESDCYPFTRYDKKLLEPWKMEEIFDPSIRRFNAYIGPSGGKRGYQSITGHTSNSLAWYINGFLAPVLWLRRGLTYYFDIHGGNNPHSVDYYHPFIITNDRHGGFDALSDIAQDQIKVFAGVEFTRRGRPRPTSAGPLCLAKHRYRDRRLDDDYPTFKKFNKSLDLNCEKGPTTVLELTPNSSWPDTVYYNSFTHSNMGWKIRIVDTYRRTSSAFPNSKMVSKYICLILFLFQLLNFGGLN